MNMSNRSKTQHKYNESSLPQTEQKYKGWHWDHITKEFYRWDNFPRLTK